MYDGPTDMFGLSCPEDSTFKFCPDASVPFFGCVAGTTNPCTPENDGHLPYQADLRPLSFNPGVFSIIPDEDCDTVTDSGQSIWWRCFDLEDNSKNFLGCCYSNPCPGGCLDEELVPAKLSSDPEKRHSFLSPLVPFDPKTSTTLPAASTGRAATQITQVLAPTDQGSQDRDRGGGGGVGGGVTGPTIAGIVLAVAALVTIMLGLAWYLIRKGKKKGNPRPNPPSPDPLDGFFAGGPIPGSGGGFFGGTLMDAVRRFRSDSNPKPKSSTVVTESLLPDVPDLSMLDDQTQSNRASRDHLPRGIAMELTSMQPKVDPCQIYIPGPNENTPASPTDSIWPTSYYSQGHNDTHGAINVPTAGSRYTISGALPPMIDTPSGTGRRRWESPDDVM